MFVFGGRLDSDLQNRMKTYLEVEEGGPGTAADQDEKRSGNPVLVRRVCAGSALGRAGGPNQVDHRTFVHCHHQCTKERRDRPDDLRDPTRLLDFNSL